MNITNRRGPVLRKVVYEYNKQKGPNTLPLGTLRQCTLCVLFHVILNCMC